MATKEDLATLLELMREADAEKEKEAAGRSTYLNPPPSVEARMGQSATPSAPPAAEPPGALDRVLSGAGKVATGVGTMATNALDAGTLGLYSKGRNAVAGAIAPEATAGAVKAEDDFRREHEFLSGIGTGVGMVAPMGAPGMIARSGAAGLRALEGAAPAAAKTAAAGLGPALPAVGRGAALGATIGGGTTLATDVTAGASLPEALPRAADAMGAGALLGGGLGAGAGAFNAARGGAAERVAAQRQNELAAGTSGNVRKALRDGEAGINELRAASKPLDQALRKGEPGGKLIELGEKSLAPLDVRKAKLYADAKIDATDVDQIIDDMIAKDRAAGGSDAYAARLQDLKKRSNNMASDDAPGPAVPTRVDPEVTQRIPRQSMDEMATLPRPPKGVQKVADADILSSEPAPGPRRVIPAEKLRSFMTEKLRPRDYNDAADGQKAQNDLYFALRDKLSADVEARLGPKAAQELAEINKQESAWLRVMEKGDQMEGKAFGRSTTPGFDKLERKGVGGITGVGVRAIGSVAKGAYRAGNEALAKAPAIPTALARPLEEFAVGRDPKKLTLGLTDYLFGDTPVAPGVAGAAKAAGRAIAGPPTTGGVRPEAAGSLLQLARSGAPRQEIEDKGREMGLPPEDIERIASVSARQQGAMR